MFQQLSFKSKSDKFASALAIMLMIVSLLYPAFIYLFLRINFHKLETIQFKQRYSALFEGLNPRKKNSIFFYVLFTFRRLIFAVSAVVLTGHPTIQIFFLFMQCVLIITYLGTVKPFEAPFNNKLEMFNEICIIGVCYHLMLFTDFLPSPPKQYLLGWSLIGITVLNVVTNMGILFFMGSRDLKIKFIAMWRRFQAYLLRKNSKAKKYEINPSQVKGAFFGQQIAKGSSSSSSSSSIGLNTRAEANSGLWNSFSSAPQLPPTYNGSRLATIFQLTNDCQVEDSSHHNDTYFRRVDKRSRNLIPQDTS